MVKTVQCPSCASSFLVDTRKVPADGVYARCSSCSGIFFVDAEPPPPAAAAAAEPGAAEAPHAQEHRPSGESDTPAEEPTWPPREAPEPPLGEAERAEEGPPSEDAGEGAAGGEAAVETAVAAEPELPEPLARDSEAWPLAEPDGETAAVSPAKDGAAHAPEEPPEVAAEPLAPSPFSFGRRDPHEKARRLARVLVSDMVMYHPEMHRRALERDSLREDFDEEIRRSWQEYTAQVGDEMASGTSYFNDALNEILAGGRALFP